mgnify:CR=1 FL=1
MVKCIMNIRRKFSVAAILFFILFVLLQCKKKTNHQLYSDATASGLSFYKGKDTIYSPGGGSPHGTFKPKFNATALAALGADGKLPQGGEFPKGSLVVKEVYSGGALTLYAVMKKDNSSRYASNAWVWAEYKPNGDTQYDISKNGAACTDCHSASPHRDLVRSFDLH